MTDEIRACLERCRTWIADIEETGSESPMAVALLADIDRLLSQQPHVVDTATGETYTVVEVSKDNYYLMEPRLRLADDDIIELP